MVRMLKNALILLLPLMLLAGCESMPGLLKSEQEPAEVVEGGQAGAEQAPVTAAEEAAQAHGMEESGGLAVSSLDDPNSPLAVRVIYFDYDSSEVKAEYREAVEAHATYLSRHPDTIVTLEGHTDERGSREYNLALGERRAIAVRRQMVLLGASAGQIRTVSYGEERPLAEGHDEQAYAQNRRVEIKY